MKKQYRYYLSPDKTMLYMTLSINSMPAGFCSRFLGSPFVVQDNLLVSDVTTHDLELHAFMRFSHQFIVNKDALEVSIQDSFELENPNLV